MINFSSHNIQTTHRSGYMPTVVNNNNAGSSIKDTKEIPSKIYSYATTLKSPGLKYFVSNIAYNAQFDKESDVSSPTGEDGKTRLKIGYINDVHGQYIKLAKIGDALRDCDIRFSGGDNMIGDDRNKQVNNCVLAYMDGEDFESSALGNHDVDMSEKNFKELTDNLKMKYLAANFKQDIDSKDSPKGENGAFIHDKLVDSYIGDYKGVQYGVVGIAPVDMRTRMTHPELYTDFTIDSMEDTIKDIQEEVKELQDKGIKHIFLLSHVGHLGDRIIAENTSGIDVIIGGHSHTYVDGIKPGENLFVSKAGEPVLITNAEKDGNYYGKAELVFDKDGVLVEASNNLYETSKRPRNMIYKKMFNDIMGHPEKLGVINSALPCPKQRLSEENPHANFVADAIRNELNVDIGIVNAGNIRNVFEPGEIDSSDVKSISPFGDGMAITTISEKDLVEGIKGGCKSVVDKNGKPGLIYASGLTYSVKKETGELLDMTYTAKDGTQRKIDINNPDSNKIYRIAADDFVLRGGDGLTAFNQLDHAEKIFDFSEDKLIADYIKHQNKPIDINITGRINIV
ncbi:5'-nucleotidase C-terminal domain-containing protein [bacterium]|nr:5'-nucleotidase C-terminal domain-containing protein [bacterium]